LDRKFLNRVDHLLELLISKFLVLFATRLRATASTSASKVTKLVKSRLQRAEALAAGVTEMDADTGVYTVQSGAKK
jgi:hypothetical protein